MSTKLLPPIGLRELELANRVFVSRLCHRHLIFERGEIFWQGSLAALQAASDIQAKYLGV